MRSRRAVFFGMGICTGAFFLACGSDTFTNSTDDDAGSGDSGISADGTIGDAFVATDAPSTRDDGGVIGPKDGGGSVSDASLGRDADVSGACTTAITGPIPLHTVGEIACQGDTCSSTTAICCVTTETGATDCASGCLPGELQWKCQRNADCTNADCCLTSTTGVDKTSCPLRAEAASSCQMTGTCGAAAHLCRSTSDCTLPQKCVPLYATFGGVLDAGSLVGVCLP